MTTLPGYKDLVQIHDGDNSRVYRGKYVEDEQLLILKILKADYPTPEQIRRYRQEYYLTHQLQLPNVIKAYRLENWQRTLVMVIEDIGGISLRQWLREHPQGLSIGKFLPLAVKIAAGLGQLHSQNIIHKDINSANIVFNPETEILKIIDLGISTQLGRENWTLQTPNSLEGTMAYLSPEQTGRMNRILDYRTDFYSLGVTFYELLTGRLPYFSTDPLELVHFHIAKQSIPVHEINRDVPQVLSAIVTKLMAKNAEDRYQSAWGLQADLEECLTQWKKTEIITSFVLGKKDIADQFQIPQKLYGRDEEITKLLIAFERITGKENNSDHLSPTHLVLVSGYSGIGKSALVQELYKPITAKRGHFIAGKFDQFQRNIPYSAVVSAFAGLVKQLLGEPEDILTQWRDRLLTALGTNGQVVIDVIPDVELIIGVQPPVPNLGAAESQNRFNLVLQSFIKAFCSPEHPLVIFLDDLQWADLATLDLISRLLRDSQIHNLLLIGAYRDHEVSVSHPLNVMIEQLEHQQAAIEKIILAPLQLEQVKQLIADTLHQQTAAVNDLAELVISKTQGNPFFTNEFLKTLYSENLLRFNYTCGHWQWNLEDIKAMGFTDNVVDLMVGQLQKLPQSVQDVLSLAACLGAEFDLHTLALVKNRSPVEVFADLRLAMERGFLIARSPLDENLLIQNYRFGHDRIQQAAYSLIPKPERNHTHYQIGQLILQNLPLIAREEKIFTLVNHLNYGVELITEQNQRDELAQLNLLAACKARTATAYQTAHEYTQIGVNLLGDQGWLRQYKMTLRLYEIAAEVAFACGAIHQMNHWFNTVIAYAKTPVDQVGVYIVKISSLVAQNQPLAAISLGQSILQKFGIEFPAQPCEQDIKDAMLSIHKLLNNRSVEELFDLPKMVDPEKLAIMLVAATISPPCSIVGSPLLPFLVVLQVSLSIQYGNTPYSAFSYAFCGTCLNIFTQDVTTADSFSRLAYRLASEAENKNVRSETFAVIGFFLHHRTSHLAEMLPINYAGYQVGLETGKLSYVGYNGHGFCLNSFWCGQSLSELEPQIRAYRQKLFNFHQLTTANYCSLLWETTLFLLGNPEKIQLAFIESAQEEKLISQSLAANDHYRVFAFHVYRAILRFLMGEIIGAAIDAVQARNYIAGVLGGVIEGALYFYDSLIALGKVSKLAVEIPAQVAENQTKLQFWAEHAPMNYLHKWQLVEAERYRVLGQKLEAIDFYDQAIAGAKKHGFIQEEALANELAAKFYLSWGKETIAHAYMIEAHYCYLRWGATMKVKQLEAEYPKLCQSLRSESSVKALSYQKTSQSDTSNSNNAVLDLTTIMKSSQAIASEIVLENLQQTLMKILLENAGAQSGCLLLPKVDTTFKQGKDNSFYIAASSSVDTVTISPSQPLNEIFPKSVVNYIVRTQESVVLNNAATEGKFVWDSYIQSVKPLSVLCYPLLNQGKLVGIVYLENNLTVGAFSADRIELLQLISGQAAIAITNAQLYTENIEYTHTLEAKVAERTAELEQANQKLLRIATLDGLTKIPNRRRFDDYLTTEWQRHIRKQEPLALILIDIDYFKRYNDYYGHQGGDDCLVRVAQTIAQFARRSTDLVARYGGEEFAAILPNTHTQAALMLAESMRQAIASLAIPHTQSKVSNYVSLSLGVASLIPTPQITPEDLIARADKALYTAKNQGRNQAISY